MDAIDRRQRGIPKLRDILRRQRRESEGQIDTPEIEFVYSDTDEAGPELAELYSYTEECEFQMNRDTFEFDYYQTVAEKWVESPSKVRRSYLCKILDNVESADQDVRADAARIILYIVQGNFAEVSSEEEQVKWSNQNVLLLYELEAFTVITQLLQMEIENSEAATSALHKPSISMADSCSIRVYINILYTMIERMRVPHESDTDDVREIKSTFQEELSMKTIQKLNNAILSRDNHMVLNNV